MKKQILEELSGIAKGIVLPETVLKTMNKYRAEMIMRGDLDQESEHEDCIGTGESVLEGDASGSLVLSREVADFFLDSSADDPAHTLYIYSVQEGDIGDFSAIKGSQAFFTSNPARTGFSAVQSVLEGKPTLIGVNISYHSSDENVVLNIPLGKGMVLSKETKRRWLVFKSSDSEDVVVNEGDQIYFSGNEGKIYSGSRDLRKSVIQEIYDTLLDGYYVAERERGAAQAWRELCHGSCLYNVSGRLCGLLNNEAFIGFQKLLDFSRKLSEVSVYSNVHDVRSAVMTRLIGSCLSFGSNGLRIDAKEEDYGIGLLRDERMWVDKKDIDLLRIMFLGPSCMPWDRYEQVHEIYKSRHGERYYRIFSAIGEGVCVVRTMCMPFSKFLPDDFDVNGFSERNHLDAQAVRGSFDEMRGERDVYHGCRG